jgi:hypothetical protein
MEQPHYGAEQLINISQPAIAEIARGRHTFALLADILTKTSVTAISQLSLYYSSVKISHEGVEACRIGGAEPIVVPMSSGDVAQPGCRNDLRR